MVNTARPDVPDRFAVVRELGVGGMGKVYEALGREIDLHVALKIRRPERALAAVAPWPASDNS